MEKNAVPLQKYVGIAVTIYVVGFVVAYFFLQAQGVVDHVLLLDNDPLPEAASWPLYLLQMFL